MCVSLTSLCCHCRDHLQNITQASALIRAGELNNTPKQRPAWSMGIILGVMLGMTFWGDLMSVVQAEAPAGQLSYGFKAGQSLVYEVRIEADQGDVTELFVGHPQYKVKNATTDRIQLEFTGYLEPSIQAKEGSAPGPFSLRSPYASSMLSNLTGLGHASTRLQTTEISINPKGRDISIRGSSQLPYLLGNLSNLMLEPLPTGPEQTWTRSEEMQIILTDGMLPRHIFRDDSQKLAMTQVSNYELEPITGDQVGIKKAYRMATEEKIKNKPRFEVDGQGKLTFNRSQGVFVAMTFEQTMTVRETNLTRETPLKITYRLLDEAAIAAIDSQKKRALTPDEVENVLDDLKLPSKMLGRVIELKKLAPEHPNPEVSAALGRLLDHPDNSVRYTIASALEHWATAEELPVMLKATEDAYPLVRGSALKTIFRLDPNSALKPGLKMLASKEPPERLAAFEVLPKIGASAEDGLLEFLKSDDLSVRIKVLGMLKEFGTEKSLEALKPLKLEEGQALIQRLAGEAIDAIKKRRSAK